MYTYTAFLTTHTIAQLRCAVLNNFTLAMITCESIFSACLGGELLLFFYRFHIVLVCSRDGKNTEVAFYDKLRHICSTRQLTGC